MFFLLNTYFYVKKAVGHIYEQLGNTAKSLETIRKATKNNTKDAQVDPFVGLLFLSNLCLIFFSFIILTMMSFLERVNFPLIMK